MLRDLEIFRTTEPPRHCSYLPQETASLQYRFFESLTADQFQELLIRGWRRHGNHIFRHACPECRQCVSIRVDVASFKPSKSQRRVLNRNRHISVELHPATVSKQHVDLYNAWHAEREESRGWRNSRMTTEEYAHGFLAGDYGFAHEMRYFEGSTLVGVGLVDLVPAGISSVYFYYDPRWRPLGPGTYSALCEIELCRTHGLPHLYLGYWIANCPSMAYKNQFEPYETLTPSPHDQEQPIWVP